MKVFEDYIFFLYLGNLGFVYFTSLAKTKFFSLSVVDSMIFEVHSNTFFKQT